MMVVYQPFPPSSVDLLVVFPSSTACHLTMCHLLFLFLLLRLRLPFCIFLHHRQFLSLSLRFRSSPQRFTSVPLPSGSGLPLPSVNSVLSSPIPPPLIASFSTYPSTCCFFLYVYLSSVDATPIGMPCITFLLLLLYRPVPLPLCWCYHFHVIRCLLSTSMANPYQRAFSFSSTAYHSFDMPCVTLLSFL